MAGANRSQPDSQTTVESRVGNANADPKLEKLAKLFKEFRREQQVPTRIPDVLRGAVLSALQDGMTRRQLRRACGVSS